MIAKEELDRAFDARFPKEIKEKLTAARVAVAGLGGLGSNIAVMLARSGVGHLFLVDFDRVDTTNLNRQAYRIPHLGQYKTDAIQSILAEINPYLDVQTLCVKITADNAAAIFSGWPIVCEAFDRPENKAMLVSTLLEQCPGMDIVSGNGMAGLGDCNDIRTRQALRHLYICGDEVSDTGGRAGADSRAETDGRVGAGSRTGLGLMAPRVAVCAGHQANQVLRLILNLEDAPQTIGRPAASP